MKKILLACTMALMLTGCGGIEKMFDGVNYESLTNEIGTITVYSGGIKTAVYQNAKVIYSNSDSNVLFIKFEGKEIYIQGDIIMELNN